MTRLFDPLTVRGTTMRNRLWVAPMCQYSALDAPGMPTTWHLVHLGSFATGGAGLVMTEATAVSAEGRISPDDTGIWTDEQRDSWRRIVEFIHEQGAAAGIQLAHAGRKASSWSGWDRQGRHGALGEHDGAWQTVAPSPIAFDGYPVPVELDASGIDAVVNDFVDAARRARAAGFDVLELHAAHGYLLHQFLSPLSNHRTDEFGGSLANRARLLLRVVREVRQAVGDDAALFVRFSATDYTDDGWDPAQTATVAAWAAAEGADFFDISSGGLVTGVTIPLRPGYQVPFAREVSHSAEVATSAVGLITTPEQAAQVVDDGSADAVMLGRELLRDPRFPLRAAHDLGVDISYWPPQYERARIPLGQSTLV